MKNDKIFSFLIITGIIALFSCLSLISVSAGQSEDKFALGNEAYAEGKYDEALSYYKGVLEQEGYSASLLYNMANAYYQKKAVGRAILHYERALYLDPGNADIQANLNLARKDFGLIAEPVPDWQRFFNLLDQPFKRNSPRDSQGRPLQGSRHSLSSVFYGGRDRRGHAVQ